MSPVDWIFVAYVALTLILILTGRLVLRRNAKHTHTEEGPPWPL